MTEESFIYYSSYMPSRRDVFINNHYYHLFNKTLDERRIFSNPKISQQFLDLIEYYRSLKADLRFSIFKELAKEVKMAKERIIKYRKYFKVELLAYCLIPNHFHLLIKQQRENGVIRFMSDVINSLTRYFNNLYKRKGPLFIPQFKSRMIITDEQFIHVSRYIHLNPYSSSIVSSIEELIAYPYSSFAEYLGNKKKLVNTDKILGYFNNDIAKYKQFVLDNAQYQKTLEAVKYIHDKKWL